MRSNTNAECGSVRFFPARRAREHVRWVRSDSVRTRQGRRAASLSERPWITHTQTMTPADKGVLRKSARDKRKLLARQGIGAALAAHAILLKLKPGAIVGGYHALPDEADPALLLKALVARRCHIAFPRIAGKGMPLEFHLVPDGEVLRPGLLGIHEPLAHWPKVTPDILLVPLLAFDDRGHRLGYGGGFYDRTLALLQVRAIGIAYAGQQIASLPAEAHDMALDGVLTEHGLKEFP
jgi:5-formyltetrahydrofolate cyclo-ligase